LATTMPRPVAGDLARFGGPLVWCDLILDDVIRCTAGLAALESSMGRVAPSPLTPPDMRARIRRFVKPSG